MRLLCVVLFIPFIAAPSFSQDWRYIHPYKGINVFATLGFAYDGNVISRGNAVGEADGAVAMVTRDQEVLKRAVQDSKAQPGGTS